MQMLWPEQVEVKEIQGKVAVCVPWSVAQNDVSAASRPPFSPPPSSSALPFSPPPFASAVPSFSSPPASSFAPLSAAGTDSSPAWSTAGPKEKERTGKRTVEGEVGGRDVCGGANKECKN